MLHKLISPFVGLLFVLAMSSCSGEAPSDKTNSTPSPSEAASAAAPVETAELNPDEEFINQLHEAIPETAEGNEADYIRLAGDFCGFLDDGYTPQGVVGSWVQNGGNAKAASTLLQIAVPIYCPTHSKAVGVNLP